MAKHYDKLQKLMSPKYTDRVRRLGIDLDTLEYFVRKEIKKHGIENESEDEEIFNQKLKQLREQVEEPYPKASDAKKQQPGKNVITPIIQYARQYYNYLRNRDNLKFAKYKRYRYVYDNFEYLTGISLDNLLDNNPQSTATAKRIEIDSVIKVVRASKFAQFILDKQQEFFPYRNYRRAIEMPTVYFVDKFHILPDSIKKLFLYVENQANIAVKPVENDIDTELEEVNGVLHIATEEAEIEKRMVEGVASIANMKALDEKVKRFMHDAGID